MVSLDVDRATAISEREERGNVRHSRYFAYNKISLEAYFYHNCLYRLHTFEKIARWKSSVSRDHNGLTTVHTHNSIFHPT